MTRNFWCVRDDNARISNQLATVERNKNTSRSKRTWSSLNYVKKLNSLNWWKKSIEEIIKGWKIHWFWQITRDQKRPFPITNGWKNKSSSTLKIFKAKLHTFKTWWKWTNPKTVYKTSFRDCHIIFLILVVSMDHLIFQ